MRSCTYADTFDIILLGKSVVASKPARIRGRTCAFGVGREHSAISSGIAASVDLRRR
jgi:hypothetical protein